VPIHGIHLVDLAVSDVERSLAFYLALLGPLGAVEESRDSTYRDASARRHPSDRPRRGATVPTPR
jgi:catechol 2,3-dioxygenase-like lactoylglutathione lyase family enzyme